VLVPVTGLDSLLSEFYAGQNISYVPLGPGQSLRLRLR
jgi:hypothetical protein